MRNRRSRFVGGMARLVFVRGLLRLYPRAWRERYGDELVALLDESGITPVRVLDIVRAAAYERARAIGAVLFGRTGHARYVRRRIAWLGSLIGVSYALAAAGYLIGTALDGTSVAARLQDSFVWSFAGFLPFAAIVRGFWSPNPGWSTPRPLFRPRAGKTMRTRETLFWIVFAVVTASIMRLQALSWEHQGVDIVAPGWHWFLTPAPILVMVNAIMTVTPRYVHDIQLGRRLRRRRLHGIPKHILRIDG